jgi:hypothetical protein
MVFDERGEVDGIRIGVYSRSTPRKHTKCLFSGQIHHDFAGIRTLAAVVHGA